MQPTEQLKKQDAVWQFWIDVGGTFTDCVAVDPAGQWHRHKVLSSGVVPGRVVAHAQPNQLSDPLRAHDVPNRWRGYHCRLRDQFGQTLHISEIERSQGIDLFLRDPVPEGLDPAVSYEIFSDEEAPVLAIRHVLGIGRQSPLPHAHVRLGTTRGTNALLTRQGVPTGLVVTRGLADLPLIGYQNRPDLFRLAIRKPTPLHAAVVEISARLDGHGEVLTPVNEAEVRQALESLRRQGIESLAIALLHACANPDHELAVEAIAYQVGFRDVSVSHRVAPLRKLLPRIDTTIVDAYLNPILTHYLSRLQQSLPETNGTRWRVMTSAGGLVPMQHFTGKDSLLSGPAGGCVAFAHAAESVGYHRAIGFDMGGTSTDVSRYDGHFDYEFETSKAGVRVVAPMLAIETVAAGGGSICHFDGVKLVVGPESAGAQPGPACYGQCGPLTITDANLLLGRIASEPFAFPLDRHAAEVRAQEICQQIQQQTLTEYTVPQLCAGLIAVANHHMAQAIRSISLAKGVRPNDYLLVAFGGAAPQHACGVAQELQIQQVLVPCDAGIFSALGMGLAPISRHLTRSVELSWTATSTPSVLTAIWRELADAGRQQLIDDGLDPGQLQLRESLTMRYAGVDATLLVSRPPQGDYAARFEELHQQRFGYTHPDRSIEITAVHLEVIGTSSATLPAATRAAESRQVPVGRRRQAYFSGELQLVPQLKRQELLPGDQLIGPALIEEPHSLLVVEPGWQVEVLSGGHLLMRDQGERQPIPAAHDCDPVTLEIFNQHFAAIAEQMGVTLRNTSTSVNVKERLDFSCALFDARGHLVVNAPHVPVHLGAMSETVRHVLEEFPQLDPGDVIVTNDPYRGGSHLPDITVVTPVHDESGALQFLTASRAHHAEIGGMTPGSMPPFSKTLAEEGVLIPPRKLLQQGVAHWDELRRLLARGPYPSRSPDVNLADLAAQVAANQQGVLDLRRLVERYGWSHVAAYMMHIQQAAQRLTEGVLEKMPPGVRTFCDQLDDGTAICVALEVRDKRLRVDFAGSGPVSRGNLNANRAICTAAVLYVLRCLIDKEVPLNAGMLGPVDLVIPPGILNPPRGVTPNETPAVVGGNVETSQRIVDVLLGALGVAAASQGTMNNLLFGDATFGYYETIAGGAGATPTAPGADAVHTHMTNTRLTDPEVLEMRYPVRLREFCVRRGSGGIGEMAGGCGLIRELEFLRPVTVSLLTQRRTTAPYGQHGGGSGLPGRNVWLRTDGTTTELPSAAEIAVSAGDVIRLETPGGGAWGRQGIVTVTT